MNSQFEQGSGSPIPRWLGEYDILGHLAQGGMGTVYFARRTGGGGVSRLFAIKVLHPHLAKDTEFIDMMMDEARLAALVHHPNVVPIVDYGTQDGLHYVVMGYVEGFSFSALLGTSRSGQAPRVVVSVMLDSLQGLHAAHTLAGDDGMPLNLVHRDVTPQNILVGVDGAARLTDFGIAKARARIHTTQPGNFRGKVAFLSPEQILDNGTIDRRSDVFSAGVVLWSALTGQRLFLGSSDAATLRNILDAQIPLPSTVGARPPAAFDSVCMRALERDPDARFASAEEMEEALREAAVTADCFGSHLEVADCVRAAFGDELAARRAVIREAASTRSSISGVSAVNLPADRLSPTPNSPPLDVTNPKPATPALPESPPAVRSLAPSTAEDAQELSSKDRPPKGQPQTTSLPIPERALPQPSPRAMVDPPQGRRQGSKASAVVVIAGALLLAALLAVRWATVGTSNAGRSVAVQPSQSSPPAMTALTTSTAPSALDAAAPPPDAAAPAASIQDSPPEASPRSGSRPRPAATSESAAKPASPSAPLPPIPAKKPAEWDKDSPLPPQ